jgi:hypothetical protein
MRPFTRRLFLVGAVLAALVMLIAPPFAGADDDDDGGGGGGGGDRAYCAPAGPPEPGQCSAFGGVNRYDFDASSGPLGENPMGTLRFESDFTFYEVEITCLQVTGNRASFGGRITDSSHLPSVGLGLAYTVLDQTPADVDLISIGNQFLIPPVANTPNCGDLSQPTERVTGDIVVEDNIAGGGGGGDDEDDDDDDDDGDDDDD